MSRFSLFELGIRKVLPPVATALWDPSQLATAPLVWIDSSKSASITQAASLVSAMANLGSLGGSLTAAGAAQPTYSATAANGKPGLVFGGSQSLDMAAILAGLPQGSAASSVMAVGTIGAGTGVNSALVFWGNNGAGQDRILGVNNTGGKVWFSNDSANDFNPGSSLLGANALIVASQGAGSPPATQDVSIAGTDFVGSPASVVNTAVGAGGKIGSSPFGSLTGVLQEVLILGYVPSLSDRQHLEGYAAWKWAQQAGLPAGHPYQLSAP